MSNNDWDDNESALAYLITIRTYGTWLHGDERGSVDRHGKNLYRTPRISRNENLQSLMTGNSSSDRVLLNAQQREVVETAVRDLCKYRGYGLFAINVRTNHAHCVTSARKRPELIITALKSNSTRALREAGLIAEKRAVWSRGGSRRYLWKPSHVDGAIDYVLYGQGDELPKF